MMEGLYTKCEYAWFLKVWGKHLQHVRLRRHCAFAKCTTCISLRAVKSDRTKRLQVTLHTLINYSCTEVWSPYH